MRRVRLGTLLTALVLVTSVPPAALGAWLTWTSAAQQRALIDAQNVDKAQAVSTAIDLEVERTMGGLVALSTLVPIDSGDLQRFAEIATRMLAIHPSWQAVRLIDPSLHVVASTDPAAEAPGTTGWAGTVFRTGRAGTSPLTRNASGVWVISVGVPVLRGGQVRYVVATRLRAAELTESLRRQQAPEGGVIALLDGNLTMIARTHNPERFVGGKPAPDFEERARSGQSGTWRSILLEGTPAYAAWYRSNLTGWTVGLGLASAAIDGPLRRRTAAIVTAGAAAIGVGLIVALVLGRSIVRAQVGAAAAARALARGEPVPEVRSYIADLDDLGSALRDAAGILDERIRERDAAAEALSRAKDDFIATVSHELRTPLNAIYGWVAMLRTGSLDAARQEHALKVIERNAKAQSQVVEDLLDMSSIVHGRLRLEMRPVDLVGVVRAAVDLVAPTTGEGTPGLSVTSPGGTVMVSADPARLQQIIWNLVANAFKFTAPEGRVDVTIGTAGGCAVVTVSDNGEGIAPEFLPHVFDRFRQETEQVTRLHSGLGIGLALAKDLTELHGGTIAAHSDGKGRGSIFTVRFPLPPAAI
jgi:signal transduction histidine kinase